MPGSGARSTEKDVTRTSRRKWYGGIGKEAAELIGTRRLSDLRAGESKEDIRGDAERGRKEDTGIPREDLQHVR